MNRNIIHKRPTLLQIGPGCSSSQTKIDQVQGQAQAQGQSAVPISAPEHHHPSRASLGQGTSTVDSITAAKIGQLYSLGDQERDARNTQVLPRG